jgi:hypothetical protein
MGRKQDIIVLKCEAVSKARFIVIANCEARSRKQSGIQKFTGLLHRFTPRNDGNRPFLDTPTGGLSALFPFSIDIHWEIGHGWSSENEQLEL